MDDPQPYIYLLILLILLSGVFSGAEIALVSLTPAKLRTLIEKNLPGSGFVGRIKKNPSRLLITILIGNNVVNIAASALATITAEQYFGTAGLSIAIGGMTFLILVFGEIMPKTLAQRYNVPFSLFMGPVIYILQIVLAPIIFIFEAINKIIPHKELVLATEEELKAMVDLTHEAGEITKHEIEYIKNIFEFTDTTVEEIMIPRKDIDAISSDKTVNEALDYVTKSSHTRIPVFGENIDQIAGIITMKDILKLSRKKASGRKKLKNLKLIKPVFVPMSAPISTLFKEFQKKHVHLAIVVDEHGGTEGLVTMEDVLEEIVGDILDESDREDSGIRKLTERIYMIDADVTIEDLRDHKIPMQTKIEEHKTLSYFILQKLGRFPTEGEKIKCGKNTLIVDEMDESTIHKVKLILPPPKYRD